MKCMNVYIISSAKRPFQFVRKGCWKEGRDETYENQILKMFRVRGNHSRKMQTGSILNEIIKDCLMS